MSGIFGPGNRIVAHIIRDGELLGSLEVTNIQQTFSHSGGGRTEITAEGYLDGDQVAKRHEEEPSLEEALQDAVATQDAMELAENLLKLRALPGKFPKVTRRDIVYKLMRILEAPKKRPRQEMAYVGECDAPTCYDCGAIMVHRGKGLACLNCGSNRRMGP